MTYKHIYSGESLSELKQENPTLFYKQDWYEDAVFASEHPPKGLYEINLQLKLNNLTYDEQKAKLEKDFDFIHPAVLVDFLIEHYKKTGKRLMENWYSRCSLVDSGGDHVSVGFFDSKGLGVNSYYDHDRDGRLGLSRARKLKLESSNFELVETLPLELEINGIKYKRI